MTFDQKKIHMVPPLIQDKADEVNNEGNSAEARQNFVGQLEAIRDFCQATIDKYSKDTRFKRKAS